MMTLNIKKVFSSVLAVCLMVSVCAIGTLAVEGKQPQSDIFVETCDYFFSNPEACKVVNRNGLDITHRFYSEFVDEYNAGNLDYIHQYVMDNVSSIGWKTEEIEPISTYTAYKTKTVTNNELQIRAVRNHEQQRIEAMIRIRGTFSYNQNDGIISSTFSDPTVTLELADSLGYLFTGSVAYTSGSGVLTDDRRSIAFAGEAAATIEKRIPDEVPVIGGSLDWIDDTKPYTISVVGTGD